MLRMATVTAPPASIFNEDHAALRESIRSFMTKEVVPNVEAWEESTFPDTIVKRMGDLGFAGGDARLGRCRFGGIRGTLLTVRSRGE